MKCEPLSGSAGRGFLMVRPAGARGTDRIRDWNTNWKKAVRRIQRDGSKRKSESMTCWIS